MDMDMLVKSNMAESLIKAIKAGKSEIYDTWCATYIIGDISCVNCPYNETYCDKKDIMDIVK